MQHIYMLMKVCRSTLIKEVFRPKRFHEMSGRKSVLMISLSLSPSPLSLSLTCRVAITVRNHITTLRKRL